MLLEVMSLLPTQSLIDDAVEGSDKGSAYMMIAGMVFGFGSAALIMSLGWGVIMRKSGRTRIIALVVWLAFLSIVISSVMWANKNSAQQYEQQKEGIASTNVNIKNYIVDKYGIHVLENAFISNDKPFVTGDKEYKKYVVNRGLISATNPDDKRIQISIELTDNNTDVLAFSSGIELPILKELDHK